MKSPLKARQVFYGAPHTYLNIWRDGLFGRINIGDDVEKLEETFAKELNTKHAIAVPQDRVGIYLVLNSLPANRRKVILSPYTIYDVVNMVICAGCTPIFADVDVRSANISPDSVRTLIDDETGAILVTHLHGIGCDITAFQQLCASHNLRLIEDCAQAFGAFYQNAPMGTHGYAGVFSFGMAKNINALYGGLVTTDDDELAERIRDAMTNWPAFPTKQLLERARYMAFCDLILSSPLFPLLTFHVFRYGYLNGVEAITNRLRGEDFPVMKEHFPPSYEARMTAAQARLALKQLPSFRQDAAKRREYASQYSVGLSDIEELIIPTIRDEYEDAFLTFPVQTAERHSVIRYLIKNGSDVTASHYHNCADMDAFVRFHRDCKNARSVASRMMYLPCYPLYGRSNVQKNIRLLREYFGAD